MPLPDAWTPCRQIPNAWLEALGYDWPRPALETRVNILPGLFEPKPVPNAKWRLWPVALATLLYLAAVILLWWMKNHA